MNNLENPPSPSSEDILQAVYEVFLKLCNTSTKFASQNLTMAEFLALKDLTSNKDLIIKQADKGASLVTQNRINYLEEAYRLLADTDTYLPGYQSDLKMLVCEAWKEGLLVKGGAIFAPP